MHEKSNNILMAYNLGIWALVSSSITYYWLYPFPTRLVLFIKTLPSLSSLLRKTHRVSIIILVVASGTSSQMLFCSNWFNSSWIARDQCLLIMALLIPYGSICETKATKLHTLLSDRLVVTTLDMSPITFCIGWSLVSLHSFGRSGFSC